MRSIIRAAAAVAITALLPVAAHAFTFENHGSGGAVTTPGKGEAPAAGMVDLDPTKGLPPMGESVPGFRFDHGSYSRNDGMASPPDRSGSVGPSWLYGGR